MPAYQRRNAVSKNRTLGILVEYTTFLARCEKLLNQPSPQLCRPQINIQLSFWRGSLTQSNKLDIDGNCFSGRRCSNDANLRERKVYLKQLYSSVDRLHCPVTENRCFWRTCWTRPALRLHTYHVIGSNDPMLHPSMALIKRV